MQLCAINHCQISHFSVIFLSYFSVFAGASFFFCVFIDCGSFLPLLLFFFFFNFVCHVPNLNQSRTNSSHCCSDISDFGYIITLTFLMCWPGLRLHLQTWLGNTHACLSISLFFLTREVGVWPNPDQLWPSKQTDSFLKRPTGSQTFHSCPPVL